VGELFPQAMTATIQELDESGGALNTVAASASTPTHQRQVAFRPGKGVAGIALAEHRTVTVSDVTSDPRYLMGAAPPSYRALMATPIIVAGKGWGTLSLTAAMTAAFNERDQQLIERVAQRTAIAIDKARLYEETTERAEALRRRNQELTTLYQAVTVINSELSPDVVLKTVAQQMVKALGCFGCALSLWDRERNQVETLVNYHVGAPSASDAVATTYDLALYPATRWVLENRQPQVIRRDAPDADLAELSLLPPYVHTLLMLPLQTREQVLGLVELYDDIEQRQYHKADIQLAESLAAHAAIAVNNARLFERAQTAEEQYRSLFRGNTDPIAVLDGEGIFLEINPAACRLLGKPPEQLIGKKASEFLHPAEPELRELAAQVLSGKIIRYEFSTEVSGKPQHFETRVERISYADGPAIQWTAHEVTARRELDHWRKELTGIIVHNLRNPLTWIKSGVGMAEMLLPPESDPDLVLALSKATRGIAQTEQQIDILLNIGRAESGQELTDRQPLSMGELIDEVVDLLGPRAALQEVQLHVDRPDVLPVVLGNRNLLAWTLQNLVENAIKFSPAGGTVLVNAKLMNAETMDKADSVGLEPTPLARGDGQDGAHLRVCVQDQGPGVPEADRERIFQKYYQARRPKGMSGAGLGLYFCRLAVEAHGGHIWVESNENRVGSRFSLTLPIKTGGDVTQ
jgi:PAS domain S-box-containing protein